MVTTEFEIMFPLGMTAIINLLVILILTVQIQGLRKKVEELQPKKGEG